MFLTKQGVYELFTTILPCSTYVLKKSLQLCFHSHKRRIAGPSLHAAWGSDVWCLVLCKPHGDILDNTCLCAGVWMIVFIRDASGSITAKTSADNESWFTHSLNHNNCKRLQNSNLHHLQWPKIRPISVKKESFIQDIFKMSHFSFSFFGLWPALTSTNYAKLQKKGWIRLSGLNHWICALGHVLNI